MSIIKRSEIVPYESSKMYQLVDAIDEYPNFLPWCKQTKILSRDDDEVKAMITLAWGGLQRSFTTCNRLQPHKMIEVRLLEGPFKHLEGFWRFETLEGNRCKVDLDLEFELAGGFLNMAFEPAFQYVAGSLVDAFCKRAQAVYG